MQIASRWVRAHLADIGMAGDTNHDRFRLPQWGAPQLQRKRALTKNHLPREIESTDGQVVDETHCTNCEQNPSLRIADMRLSVEREGEGSRRRKNFKALAQYRGTRAKAPRTSENAGTKEGGGTMSQPRRLHEIRACKVLSMYILPQY